MTRKQLQRVRIEAERQARLLHPEAPLIRCNPCHTDGPVVEVFDKPFRSYRYVGFAV